MTTRGTIRIIGIDTPERGRCGFGPATSNAKRLAPVGSTVTLTRATGRSTDGYGRHLRYVSRAGSDFGGAQIKAGLADARYDSRDGDGRHPRQGDYVRWDRSHPNKCRYANRSAGSSVPARPVAPGGPATPTARPRAPPVPLPCATAIPATAVTWIATGPAAPASDGPCAPAACSRRSPWGGAPALPERGAPDAGATPTAAP